MKLALLISIAAAALNLAMASASHAQNSPTVYRCAGNVYTNNAAEARANGCKPMEGGNITVVEGTRVHAGDVIAEMGRTGASRDMLHFEIRRNGKPVDPLAFLPRR